MGGQSEHHDTSRTMPFFVTIELRTPCFYLSNPVCSALNVPLPDRTMLIVLLLYPHNPSKGFIFGLGGGGGVLQHHFLPRSNGSGGGDNLYTQWFFAACQATMQYLHYLLYIRLQRSA